MKPVKHNPWREISSYHEERTYLEKASQLLIIARRLEIIAKNHNLKEDHSIQAKIEGTIFRIYAYFLGFQASMMISLIVPYNDTEISKENDNKEFKDRFNQIGLSLVSAINSLFSEPLSQVEKNALSCMLISLPLICD